MYLVKQNFILFQDIRLKVVILELLATCVETQPALTEMFLDVQLKAMVTGKKVDIIA